MYGKNYDFLPMYYCYQVNSNIIIIIILCLLCDGKHRV